MRSRLVIVHQHEGPSIEGICVRPWWNSFWHGEVRLVNAKLLEAEGQSVPLDGEVRIFRERVLFRQLVARSG